jgi:RNA polymerase sigma factor (sigma-70 family)
MATRGVRSALGEVRQLLAAQLGSQLSDEQLLERFLARREESAFAALMHRHGPMVLGVCRSVLRHPQDAEDASQATFLVLARKAASIRRQTSLASWLHGVAYRLAMKAKARRRPLPQAPAGDRPSPGPMDELTWRELRQTLHDELERLPERYRLPLILCYLEGQTQEEAARRLGWTPGALKGRLDRGRDLLRRRLTRRGLALGVPLLAASLPQGAAAAALPPSLVEATARSVLLSLSGQAVPAGVSAHAAALAGGGLKAVLATRPRAWAALLVTLGVLAAGTGLAAYRAQGARRPETAGRRGEESSVKPAAPPARADRHGDPLPPRALARVGTARWWHGGGHDSPLLFTPDGKELLCGEPAAGVRFLDAATGQELRRLRPPGDDVTSFALSPDGKTLVTAGSSGAVLRVWDVPTGQERRRLEEDRRGTATVAFAPDGKTFAAAVGQQDIQLWDAARWRPTRRLRGHTGFVACLRFLAGGKTLLSGGGTCRSIRWWDVETGRELRRLDTRLEHRKDFAVSPDGKRLAAFVAANTLQLWDAATGAEVGRVDLGKDYSVWCLCFSPDGRTLVCGNAVGRRGNQTLLFSAATGRELRRWADDSYTTHLAFSPDGKVLAQSAGGLIRLRDAATGKPALAVAGLRDYVLSVRFSRDGKALLASCFGGRTGSWDPLTGKPLTPGRDPPKGFGGRPDMLLGTALTAGGTKAALVDAEEALHVWEPENGKVCCRIADPPVGRDQADFSPDGRSLVVKHKDEVIRVWDAQTGKLRCSLPQRGSGRFPHPHTFSPDGRVLATAPGFQDGNVIRLWDAQTGKERGRLAWEDNSTPTCLLFSPDGKNLAAAHGGRHEKIEGVVLPNSVRLWDLAGGRELLRCPASAGDVRALAFSPDGKTLAAATYDTVVLWEVVSGQERGRFTGHRGWVWSLAFSPDGRMLASGSLDYTALVWDVTGVCPDGRWSHRALGPGEGERLWADLAGADGARAYRAVWALAVGGDASARFLAGRVRPVTRVEPRRLARLIAELDSDEFAARSRASEELERLGELAGAALHKALAARPGPEARRRLERLVKKLGGPVTSDALRTLRAVEALEKLGTPEARRVLAALAGGAPEARLTREANAALERLAGGVRSSGTTAAPARR